MKAQTSFSLWKVKKVKKMLVTQSYLTLSDPMDCSLPRLLCPCNSPGKNTRVGGHSSFSKESFQPRDWTWVSCFASGFFTIWATREAFPLTSVYIAWTTFTSSVFSYPHSEALFTFCHRSLFMFVSLQTVLKGSQSRKRMSHFHVNQLLEVSLRTVQQGQNH